MSRKAKCVPRLRFPDFQDAGEWEIKILGKICTITNGASNAQDHDETAIYPLFDRSEVVKKSNKFIFNCEAVIVPGEGMRFIPKYYKGRFDLHQRVYALKDFECVGKFLFFLILSRNKILAKNAVLSTVLSLRLPILQNFAVPIPPNENEQQKIADCLTSIDALITAQAKKIDRLKAYKKGLLQQLFPEPGETTPRLRFPEFRDAGEWEVKLFEKIATFSKGKDISKSDISSTGQQPCIRYGELYTSYNEIIDTVLSYTNVSAENLVLSKENDVIIPASGETNEDIATASCVLNSGIALGGDLNIIRTKVNGVFLSYYLNNAKKHEISQLAQGISVIHLYLSQLKKLELDIPSPKEQQKIADCLTSIDTLITAQAKKLDNLKAHKKGLMQQLFPAADEGNI